MMQFAEAPWFGPASQSFGRADRLQGRQQHCLGPGIHGQEQNHPNFLDLWHRKTVTVMSTRAYKGHPSPLKTCTFGSAALRGHVECQQVNQVGVVHGWVVHCHEFIEFTTQPRCNSWRCIRAKVVLQLRKLQALHGERKVAESSTESLHPEEQ